MPTAPVYYEAWKQRRMNLSDTIARWGLWNHPNRLSKITVSGGFDISIDTRISPAAPYLTAYTEEIHISVPETSMQRMFSENVPVFRDSLYVQRDANLQPAEFRLMHAPAYPWKGITIQPDEWPLVTAVGTYERKDFMWNGITREWVETDTTTGTYDCRIDEIYIDGGGIPPELDVIPGGKGEDTAADDEMFRIDVACHFPSTPIRPAPYLRHTILRSPYSDSWADETAAFNDAFDDYINSPSLPGSAITSATCSFSISFTH